MATVDARGYFDQGGKIYGDATGASYGQKRMFVREDGSTITGRNIGGSGFLKRYSRNAGLIFGATPYEPTSIDRSFLNVQSPRNPGIREVAYSGYGEVIPVSIGQRAVTGNVIDASPLTPRLVGYREWYEMVKEPSDAYTWQCSDAGWAIEGFFGQRTAFSWNFNVAYVEGRPPSSFCYYVGYSGFVIANNAEEAVARILDRCGCGYGVG